VPGLLLVKVALELLLAEGGLLVILILRGFCASPVTVMGFTLPTVPMAAETKNNTNI
jgi:hypothetical protein